ncbi:MAG: hypothetical protein AB7O52_05930 [Planctomycetota bacterium]
MQLEALVTALQSHPDVVNTSQEVAHRLTVQLSSGELLNLRLFIETPLPYVARTPAEVAAYRSKTLDFTQRLLTQYLQAGDVVFARSGSLSLASIPHSVVGAILPKIRTVMSADMTFDLRVEMLFDLDLPLNTAEDLAAKAANGIVF